MAFSLVFVLGIVVAAILAFIIIAVALLRNNGD